MIHLDKNLNGEIVFKEFPFKSKYTKDGKLYRKKHGKRHVLSNGASTCEIENPYDIAKINQVEFKNFPEDVLADFFILDSVDGLYQQLLGVPAESITPNAPLTQHGFTAAIGGGNDKDVSEYDATLLKGMKIKIVFDNGSPEKTVGVNAVFHEVKVPTPEE